MARLIPVVLLLFGLTAVLQAQPVRNDALAKVTLSVLPQKINSYPSTLPNVKPFHPAGWSGPIVVSKVRGTNTDDFPINANEEIFIDSAIINDSNVAIPQGVLVYLTVFFDGESIAAYYSNGMPPNSCLYVEDVNVSFLDPGNHEIRVVADYYSLLTESNEEDNEIIRIISIGVEPNPDIRAEPKPLVIYREAVTLSGEQININSVKANISASEPDEWAVKLKSRTVIPKPISAITESVDISQNESSGNVVIQFYQMPDREKKDALKSAGIVLKKYVSKNAWIASLPKNLNNELIKKFGIRSIIPMIPADKISPVLQKKVQSPKLLTDEIQTVRVRLFKETKSDEAIAAVRAAGGVAKDIGIPHTLEVTIPRNNLSLLAKQSVVQWIEDKEPEKTQFNDFARSNVGADVVQLSPHNLSGNGVSIAIWDSGRVDSEHPDLEGRITFGDSTYPAVSTHATHVAGTIAGNGMNSESKGYSPFQMKGIAPAANIVSYFWDDNISEYPAALITQGCVISQNSWGYIVGYNPGSGVFYDNRELFGSYEGEQAIYDDIIRGLYGRRVVICWAAGNDRDDCSPVYGCDSETGYGCIPPPGTAKNMITVGAINSDDDSMTVFSGWGPTDDGRIKPEIVAPGCQAQGDYGTTSTVPGGNYATYCGTSMACPVVSGAAALIIERFKDLNERIPLPSTTKALMLQSAIDLGRPGPDYCFGYGKLNLPGAIQLINAGSWREGIIEHQGVSEYYVDVPAGSQTLEATLAWDDAPGFPGSERALVNDLNLEIISPTGSVYRPWILNPNNPSAPATTGIDNINPVEKIQINNPMPGHWKVRVVGFSIPEGPQTFSLICNHFAPQGTIEVHNDGISRLRVQSISKQNNSNWLAVSPTAFDVPAGQTQLVNVDVAVAGLQPGVYNEKLLFEWNSTGDNGKPNPYPVPIELRIIPRYHAASLKAFAQGARVKMTDKIVIAGTDEMNGAFYVEEMDRSSGIRVVPYSNSPIRTGDKVSIDGIITVIDGEVVINDANVTVISSGNSIPDPLVINTRILGGGNWYLQQGPWAYMPAYNTELKSYEVKLAQVGGVNNTGLLIQLIGEITQINADSFYVSDGANLNESLGAPKGVKVILENGQIPPGLAIGSKVILTGISSCYIGPEGKVARLVRVKNQDGIITIQ